MEVKRRVCNSVTKPVGLGRIDEKLNLIEAEPRALASACLYTV